MCVCARAVEKRKNEGRVHACTRLLIIVRLIVITAEFDCRMKEAQLGYCSVHGKLYRLFTLQSYVSILRRVPTFRTVLFSSR